ncbi:hypothetical protein [Aurantiacibacter marinus]|uniref:Uncharacterized protein n=1 Tax=Aurantiacibacter marinus TaxID=874156 RepID=A0A0H0XPP2_9SPHN|nr:hypothetical protein [Aurantiacibacter marinus]KLI63981.1 hypothetical protein AAV99_09855 [Aurantiacibacter marinus]
MKTIFALAGVCAASLTLAACGGNDAAEPTEAVIDDTVATTPVASDAGTYTSLTEDGTELAISLNADGSYAVTEAGEQVETGTWEDTAEGACWTAQGAAEADCATFAPGVEAGTVDMTNSAGDTLTFSYTS